MTIRPGLLALTLLLTLSGQAQAYSYAAAGKEPLIDAREALLGAAGFELVPVRDGHLCCGSAGTYSLLQPEISRRLRDDKLDALQGGGAESIVSANIGCIEHLGSAAKLPVRHWVELLFDDENVT